MTDVEYYLASFSLFWLIVVIVVAIILYTERFDR